MASTIPTASGDERASSASASGSACGGKPRSSKASAQGLLPPKPSLGLPCGVCAVSEETPLLGRKLERAPNVGVFRQTCLKLTIGCALAKADCARVFGRYGYGAAPAYGYGYGSGYAPAYSGAYAPIVGYGPAYGPSYSYGTTYVRPRVRYGYGRVGPGVRYANTSWGSGVRSTYSSGPRYRAAGSRSAVRVVDRRR